MPPTRSTTDRRRRVLYANHSSGNGSMTAAGRREFERLREARRPTARYAERVQRRLQGKWFSLVPVSRRKFTIVAASFASLTMLLVLMHFAAVTWPRLAHTPDIARPFRLDRADSFGRWYISMLLAASAGIALMTYQLRRYRIDDYRGQYRLWRTVLMVTTIASIGVSTSLVTWGGELLDAAFGKRVALAGADWIRLLVSIGGTVLVLRLIAETHRSRLSLFALLITFVSLALPEAAGWNLFSIDTPAKWVAVTSAPLIGCTALFLSLGAYLRTLYREVCEIEDSPTLREHLGNISINPFRRSDNNDVVEDAGSDVATIKSIDLEPKPRWWHRKPKRSADAKTACEPVEKRKGFFGLRSQATDSQAPDSQAPDSQAPDSQPAEKAEKKKPEQSKPIGAKPKLADTPVQSSETDAAKSDPPKKRRFGLGGFLKRKDVTNEDQTDGTESDEAADQSSNSNSSAPSDNTGGADIDADSIDWDSLSKAERRRLRKQLKRQNRAA